jgi:VIT1/CCC1 family predicted Fe2+/Mn2+ transporter
MVNNLGETKMSATAQKVTAINVAAGEKQLSMTPDAIRRRERRAAAKVAIQETHASVALPKKADVLPKAKAATRKLPTAAPIKVSAAQKRTIGQFVAAIASGFLPIASFVIAHHEANTQPLLWLLVAAALLFSAPSVASWAQKWCGNTYKAWGFTVLLEGVLVFAHHEALSIAGLTMLVMINAANAWQLAARREA